MLLAFQPWKRITECPGPNLLLTDLLLSASRPACHSHWADPCLSLSQHTWSLPDSQTHSFQAPFLQFPPACKLLPNRTYMLGMLINIQINYYLICCLFHKGSHWQENGDSWLLSHRLYMELPPISPLLPWPQDAFTMNSPNLLLTCVSSGMLI